MITDKRLLPCPFCGVVPEIAICDDEGNIHDEEYAKNPYSGLHYEIIHHTEQPGAENCPIACHNDGFDGLGTQLYDSIDELLCAWNVREDPEVEEGEIFFLSVPTNRDAEIRYDEGFNIFFPPSMLQGNVYRMYCVGQPRIKHKSLGHRSGFGRELTFTGVHVSEPDYNMITQWFNNHRMAFFVRDRDGNIEVLYDPRYRTKIDIEGTDEINHIIQASTGSFPYRTPISLLVDENGLPVHYLQFEKFCC